MREFPLGFFGGLRLVATDSLSTTTEDWSEVRSPGRAKRRRKKHRQKIKHVVTPKNEAVIDQHTHTVYVHPQKLAELKDALAREAKLDRAVRSGPVVEPSRAFDVERMNMEAFAFAHIGIWSPNLRVKRFDRFPEEMGGDRAQADIYKAARERYGAQPLNWIMPEIDPWRVTIGELGDTAEVSLVFEPVAFTFHQVVFERQIKTVMAFADDDSERRFYERLRAIRRRVAEEDARWGTRELKLKAPPEPDFGRYHGRVW